MNNFDLMRKRLEWYGGIEQEDRMIKSKLWTFQRALKYSYQGCTITKVQPYDIVLDADPDNVDPTMNTFPLVRALINPDKVKYDYDDKILSVEYRHQFAPGDVFQWVQTNSYWLIQSEELTEDAYFRGSIRRCKYKIKFKDKDNNWCYTWAAIRGPVETQINSIQKNEVRLDLPNLSLHILMPLNEITRNIFDRYSEFIFEGKCWRVNTTDSVSIQNVLEIHAEEYFIDKDTDDVVNEIKNGLVVEPINPSPNSQIQGETFIKPKITETYIAPDVNGTWKILENCPVTLQEIENNKVLVTWKKSVSGQFTLQWQKEERIEEKVIVVESLF